MENQANLANRQLRARAVAAAQGFVDRANAEQTVEAEAALARMMSKNRARRVPGKLGDEMEQESKAGAVQYIGTKIIRAEPMTRGEWCAYRGWNLPADENGEDAGYIVEYTDGGKPNCLELGFAGYVSWSPAEQFENAYRPTSGLSFGLALEAVKMGKKAARAGWNGKGMWIAHSPGSLALPADRFWNPHNRAFAEANGGTADVLPCITFKTADGKILMGWLASQTDMLADDWIIIE